MSSENRREITCHYCPEHCWLHLTYQRDQLESVEGNRCSLGADLARETQSSDKTYYTGMMSVSHGVYPQATVRSKAPLSVSLHQAIDRELESKTLSAPVEVGQVVFEDILRTGVDLLATSTVYRSLEPANPRFIQLLKTVKSPKFKVAICAHRGDLRAAPENTLAAFDKAIELESDIIEFDIHLTKDNQVIVCHDSDIDRTTDDKGKIRKLTLDELKSISAGAWFHEDFGDERIPTLAETLERIRGKAIPLVEIKYPLSYNKGIEEHLFPLLRELDFEDQTLISVRHYDYALQLKELSDKAWILYLSFTRGQMKNALSSPLDGTSPYWRIVNRELVELYRERGKIILPWTVDDTKVMADLADYGIDGIITNELWDLMKVLVEGDYQLRAGDPFWAGHAPRRDLL